MGSTWTEESIHAVKVASGSPALFNLGLVLIHMKLLLGKNAVKCRNPHMVKPIVGSP